MLETKNIETEKKLICYHCGEDCPDDEIAIGEKLFCCNGCKTVYELLDANDLCTYYNIDETPGVYQKNDIKKNTPQSSKLQVMPLMSPVREGNVDLCSLVFIGGKMRKEDVSSVDYRVINSCLLRKQHLPRVMSVIQLN